MACSVTFEIWVHSTKVADSGGADLAILARRSPRTSAAAPSSDSWVADVRGRRQQRPRRRRLDRPGRLPRSRLQAGRPTGEDAHGGEDGCGSDVGQRQGSGFAAAVGEDGQVEAEMSDFGTL
jgi:hypothetical protein